MALYRSGTLVHYYWRRQCNKRYRALGLALIITSLFVILHATATRFESQLQGHSESFESSTTVSKSSFSDYGNKHLGAEQYNLALELSSPSHPTTPLGSETVEHAIDPKCVEPATDVKAIRDGGADFFENTRHIIAAMRRVTSLAPDEIRIGGLLRPLVETGEANLRDLGLRTRAFKTYFEAWETLHLYLADGSFHRREDVVQHLRNGASASSDLTDMIYQYDKFREFLTHLASLLFP